MIIVAVVVTFNPDADILNSLMDTLHPQVDHILVIDNASDTPVQLPALEKVSLVTNSVNKGLGYAYNLGREQARAFSASHLLLFDQDSCPAPDMVSQLKNALLCAGDSPVAAVGPRYSDVKGQYTSPFVVLSGITLKRVDCADGELVEVDHLISSGCLIALDAWEDVGPFEEQLFIDYVDTEWCWRARRKGYRLLGAGSARMVHNLGDDEFMAFGKPRVLHAPFRLYYQMRNRCWMILQPGVGWRWRVMDSLRSIKIFLAIALFSPNRWQRIKYMSKGIVDGLCAKMGRAGQ